MNKKFNSKKLMMVVQSNLKELAIDIKKDKSMRKIDKREGRSIYEIDSCVRAGSREFRSKHIAYCLLRGTPYNEIESPRDGNEPDWYSIDKYIEKWGIEIEQDVCVSA